MSEKKWFAVYTRPRWEKKVAEKLSRKGLENYCPLNRVHKKWADRKKIVWEPLFSSYVFVRVTDAERTSLRETPGVINLVQWLGKPAVIRDSEIAMIAEFLKEHQDVRLDRTDVNVNDIARITTGALSDLEGQIIGINGKYVKLILPSLGFAMVAETEASNVIVIHKPGFDTMPGTIAGPFTRIV